MFAGFLVALVVYLAWFLICLLFLMVVYFGVRICLGCSVLWFAFTFRCIIVRLLVLLCLFVSVVPGSWCLRLVVFANFLVMFMFVVSFVCW